MIRCDTCPYCKDTYPEKTDSDGNHFCICGMTGNMVYTEPRRVKKVVLPRISEVRDQLLRDL